MWQATRAQLDWIALISSNPLQALLYALLPFLPAARKAKASIKAVRQVKPPPPLTPSDHNPTPFQHVLHQRSPCFQVSHAGRVCHAAATSLTGWPELHGTLLVLQIVSLSHWRLCSSKHQSNLCASEGQAHKARGFAHICTLVQFWASLPWRSLQHFTPS